MRKDSALSPHSKKVLEVLHKSEKPLSAYELMDKLRKFGIKAPPTIYRALETLVKRGLAHRIETLSAFVACHDNKSPHEHIGSYFAVCSACGHVEEVHDHQLSTAIKNLAETIKFHIEREMLELVGLCKDCTKKA
jgi:Fur family zinc uptake transcriptional regulator